MTAEHIFARADKAAREVDPIQLASALDHIAKTASKSRTQTRRLRWIEQRALFALEGREYRDIDVDLPKDAGDTAQRMKYQRDSLKRVNARLTKALQSLVDMDLISCRGPAAKEAVQAAVDALAFAKSTDEYFANGGDA